MSWATVTLVGLLHVGQESALPQGMMPLCLIITGSPARTEQCSSNATPLAPGAGVAAGQSLSQLARGSLLNHTVGGLFLLWVFESRMSSEHPVLPHCIGTPD